jgi:hypothetical protein
VGEDRRADEEEQIPDDRETTDAENADHNERDPPEKYDHSSTQPALAPVRAMLGETLVVAKNRLGVSARSSPGRTRTLDRTNHRDRRSNSRATRR